MDRLGHAAVERFTEDLTEVDRNAGPMSSPTQHQDRITRHPAKVCSLIDRLVQFTQAPVQPPPIPKCRLPAFGLYWLKTACCQSSVSRMAVSIVYGSKIRLFVKCLSCLQSAICWSDKRLGVLSVMSRAPDDTNVKAQVGYVGASDAISPAVVTEINGLTTF